LAGGFWATPLYFFRPFWCYPQNCPTLGGCISKQKAHNGSKLENSLKRSNLCRKSFRKRKSDEYFLSTLRSRGPQSKKSFWVKNFWGPKCTPQHDQFRHVRRGCGGPLPDVNFGPEKYSAPEILRVKVSNFPSNAPKLGAPSPPNFVCGEPAREGQKSLL